jgi:hypothetical protein
MFLSRRHVSRLSALILAWKRLSNFGNSAPAQAERLIPVKLTGVVTDLSGYKNSFFFQDETGGISVDRTDSADVHAGDRVEIVGTSGPGLFAPVVLASRVIVHRPEPSASDSPIHVW